MSVRAVPLRRVADERRIRSLSRGASPRESAFGLFIQSIVTTCKQGLSNKTDIVILFATDVWPLGRRFGEVAGVWREIDLRAYLSRLTIRFHRVYFHGSSTVSSITTFG
jgi:hypothetical protein